MYEAKHGGKAHALMAAGPLILWPQPKLNVHWRHSMISSIYAALLGLLFIRLSALTIRERRRASVALGDAGDIGLQRTIRVHANFSEYVPITLTLIYMIESLYALPVLVHLLGLGLLIGRLSHAYGVSQPRRTSASASRGWP